MMQTRNMTVNGRYLNVPVKAGVPRRLMSLEVLGEVVRAFEVELATDEVDFWAFVDVSVWNGAKLDVKIQAQPTVHDEEVQRHSAEHPLVAGCLDVLEISDEIKDADGLYQETLRPQFHFTTRRGWHNDPNGMVYHEGEYHLFFQHQPFSVDSFSDKSWGHAVSRDLVHWEERPIALHADHEGQKWSGSGVVDWHNVSGLQQGGEPPILLFYTATAVSAQNPKETAPGDFVQSIAFSNDRGHSWETYAGNPIIPNITPGNRDPLVFWHEPTQRWVMTLFVGQPKSWLNDQNQVAAQIFTSVDLKVWCYESTVEGFFDCPVLFSLPLDGDESDLRWVMYCADMRYRVGRFDGRVFTPETDFLTGQHGECAYAPQLFNHAPDGRRIQIAWGRTKAPGMPFSQIMTFPCELSMTSTDEGPRMRWTPVKELEKLYGEVSELTAQDVRADSEPLVLVRARHSDVELIIDVGDACEIALNVRGIPLQYDVREKSLTANGHSAPVPLADGRLSLRLLVDRISMEIFASGGLIYMPVAVIPTMENGTIAIRARGGSAKVDRVLSREVNSIWKAHR